MVKIYQISFPQNPKADDLETWPEACRLLPSLFRPWHFSRDDDSFSMPLYWNMLKKVGISKIIRLYCIIIGLYCQLYKHMYIRRHKVTKRQGHSPVTEILNLKHVRLKFDRIYISYEPLWQNKRKVIQMAIVTLLRWLPCQYIW